MSWEVSSMPSKRSFFNRTLFRKNLSRSWPLWGLLSLAGAMIPLYFLLEAARFPAAAMTSGDFASGLYQAVTIFAPGFTACYAILCAMLVWGYLYNPRAVSLFHALPVDRTCLFATNVLSGLVMIAVPYAVTGGLICLVAAGWGFLDMIAVVNTTAAVVCLAAAFFGLATLCAMLTGHIFALPAFYLLANFLSPILESLIFNMARQFLVGIDGDALRYNALSPIVQIYTSFNCRWERINGATGDREAVLHGLWVTAAYALLGLAMLALAWFLYKKRHSECAGDVVAFRWLRPVFRYGTALLGGLTVGRLLYEALWKSIFQRGEYASAVPMAVCMALGGLLGFYTASMLLEKSRRVFRGSLPGAAAVCAGAAALVVLVSADVFGAERRVPEPDEIESVQLQDRSIVSGPFYSQDSPEQVEALRAFHQALVDDRAYIRGYVPDFDGGDLEGKVFSHNIWLIYRLKDGTLFRRNYDLWLTEDRVKTEGTFDNLLEEFYQDPEVRKFDVTIPEDCTIKSIDVFFDYQSEGVYGVNTSERSDGDAQTLYKALLQDAEAGNIPAKTVLARYGSHGSLWFELEYLAPLDPWDGSWHYGYKDVHIHPQMENTLDALAALGYLTEEERALWEWQYESDRRDGAGVEVYRVQWPAVPDA